MESLRERPALYYPYIHIRSEHWLKATLLYAPTVTRIVPDGYVPEDAPKISRYAEIEGPHGPLLQAVRASSPTAMDAQHELLSKLQTHSRIIKAKYSRSLAPQEDAYWIHDAKVYYQLNRYLKDQNLAWHSTNPKAYGHRD